MRSNTRQAVLLSLCVFAVVLTGCVSDGQVGEKGIVRFSQILRFADTDDFTAPIAVGYTVLVALQETERLSWLHDGATRVDLTLEVEGDGRADASVFPMGFGQYGVVMERPGTYRLVAVLDGEPIDQVTVRAADPKGIRLSQRVSVFTSSEACSDLTTYEDGIENNVMHANQVFEVYVVPFDENGDAMLGLLPITASHDGPLGFDAPLIGHAQKANALVMEPVGMLGGEQTVYVTEEDSGEVLEVVILSNAEEKPIVCD